MMTDTHEAEEQTAFLLPMAVVAEVLLAVSLAHQRELQPTISLGTFETAEQNSRGGGGGAPGLAGAPGATNDAFSRSQ